MKVLVAEDDEHTRNGLIEILEAEGYQTIPACDGKEAVELFCAERPDFVCLDIMMPGASGYDVCKDIRARDASVPLIFISAKSEEIDKVVGLELGADDFIVKPFGVREVVARIRAVTRRCLARSPGPRERTSFRLDDLEVFPAELRARRGDETIELSLREVKLLELFHDNQGVVLDRNTIFDACWGVNYLPSSRTLDQHISKLRKRRLARYWLCLWDHEGHVQLPKVSGGPSMKALVTGANGFIGSHLVEALCAAKVDVCCLVRNGGDLRWLRGRRVGHVQGDCRDRESLRKAVRNVDVVFHLAGLVRAKSYRDYFEVNSQGTRNLIDACLACNPNLKRFVLVSSQAVAGPSPDGRKVSERDAARPISAYGWSKLMAEREVLAERERVPVVVLRPAPVYGPRDTEFHTLFKLVRMGLRPVLGTQKRYLNLIYVKDLVDGCLLAMVKQVACGQTYFLAEDRTYSWEDIGRIIGIASRRKTRRVRIPANLSQIIAGCAELLAGFCGRAATINREKAREMLARYWLCDTALVRRELGFETSTPLLLGAEDTYWWYRNHGWL